MIASHARNYSPRWQSHSIVWFIGICLMTNSYLVTTVWAQTPDSPEVNFSEMDWEEDSAEEKQESFSENLGEIDWDAPAEKGEGLDTMNWEDDSSASSENLGGINWDENRSVVGADIATSEVAETAEWIIHTQGLSLFVLYFIGFFATPFFFRKSPATTIIPPELQIFLYSFWPLAWVVFPVIGKKSES